MLAYRSVRQQTRSRRRVRLRSLKLPTPMGNRQAAVVARASSALAAKADGAARGWWIYHPEPKKTVFVNGWIAFR